MNSEYLIKKITTNINKMNSEDWSAAELLFRKYDPKCLEEHPDYFLVNQKGIFNDTMAFNVMGRISLCIYKSVELGKNTLIYTVSNQNRLLYPMLSITHDFKLAMPVKSSWSMGEKASVQECKICGVLGDYLHKAKVVVPRSFDFCEELLIERIL